MQLKEIMTREPDVVRPGASVREAAQKMKDLDVGLMPVCDGKRLVGMLTDRDITVRATAAGKDPNEAKVEEAMTPEVVYAFEDQDVEEAADLMERNQLRRLIVLDRGKQMTGVVSLGDVAVKTGKRKITAETTERVSEPAEPER